MIFWLYNAIIVQFNVKQIWPSLNFEKFFCNVSGRLAPYGYNINYYLLLHFNLFTSPSTLLRPAVSASVGQKMSAASFCSLIESLRRKHGCRITRGVFYSKLAKPTVTCTRWEGKLFPWVDFKKQILW